MLRLLIKDITVAKGPRAEAGCDCIFAGRAARPKRSSSACRRTAPKRFAIRCVHCSKSAPWQPCTMTDEIVDAAQPRWPQELHWQTLHGQHDHAGSATSIASPARRLPAGTFNVSQVRNATASVCGWSITGSTAGLLTAQRRKPGLPYAITHYRHDRSQTAGLGCQLSPHCHTIPKPELNKVHYAVHIEMPSGRSLPLAFGMNTLLIGSGR